MSSGLSGSLDRVKARFLSSRRIYIRSDHKTRYFSISPLGQWALGLALTASVGWTAFTTYSVVTTALDAKRAETRIESMREAFEARIDQLEQANSGLEAQIASVETQRDAAAAQLNSKQALLTENMVSLQEARAEIAALKQQYVLAQQARRNEQERLASLEQELNAAKLDLVEREVADLALGASFAKVGTAMQDVIAERDEATERLARLDRVVGDLQGEIVTMEGREELVLGQLESAARISLEGLDKLFGGAKLDLDRILTETKRDYSGSGGPFEPLFDQTEKASEADQRVATLLNDLERVNLMRFAAQRIPFGAPVKGGRHTSGFGPRRDPIKRRTSMHNGFDIAAPRGTPIYATADGVVTYAGRQRGYGTVVKIRHAFGFETVYAHLNRSKVKVGQRVERGDHIAGMGNTGRSTGVHLHYEVRIDRVAVNPWKFIKAARDVL